MQVDDRLQRAAAAAAAQLDHVAAHVDRAARSRRGRASRAAATASPCETTRVDVGPRAHRRVNQPPRLAHAEPVAGSSRIAGAVGEEEARTRPCPRHRPRRGRRRPCSGRPRSSAARTHRPAGARGAPPRRSRAARSSCSVPVLTHSGHSADVARLEARGSPPARARCISKARAVRRDWPAASSGRRCAFTGMMPGLHLERHRVAAACSARTTCAVPSVGWPANGIS